MKETREPTREPQTDIADFDRIAAAYRWLEYATLGPLLERVRWWFLDRGSLGEAGNALILGDGDGRFTARLLRRNRRIKVTAVDLSARMLELLQGRCLASRERLTIYQADARSRLPRPSRPVDLVVTHFFLDCLTDAEVTDLVTRVSGVATRDARWLVSEFRIPAGPLRWPALVFVRMLYLAFQFLTGLQVTRLPRYAEALARCGFRLGEARLFLGGLLVTELWERAKEEAPGELPEADLLQ